MERALDVFIKSSLDVHDTGHFERPQESRQTFFTLYSYKALDLHILRSFATDSDQICAICEETMKKRVSSVF